MCKPVGLRIRLLNASVTVGYTPVTVSGIIERTDGTSATGVNLPTAVGLTLLPAAPLETSSSVSVAADGNFSFTVNAAPDVVTQADTTIVLKASPATDATLMVAVRTLPPTVTVEVLAADAGGRPTSWGNPTAYRRDEVALVKVSATESIEVRALKVGDAEATPGGACGCNLSDPMCACFQAELWKPTFGLMTGTMPLQVFAVNARGVGVDGGVAVDGGSPVVAVTRLRWTVTPSASGFGIRAAPVVDDEGTVYVGDQASSTVGTIYAYRAIGKAKPGWDAGVSVGSVTSLAFWRGPDPSAGTTADDVVYFNANNATSGVLSAVSTAGALSAGRCDSFTSAPTAMVGLNTYSAIAIAEESGSNGTGTLSAVATFNAQGATLGAACMWNPAASLARATQPMLEQIAVSSPAASDTQGVHNLMVTRPAGSSNQYLIDVARIAGLAVQRRTITPPNSFDLAATVNTVASGSSSASMNGLAFIGAAAPGQFGPFALAGTLAPTGLWKVSSTATASKFLDSVSAPVVDRTGRIWSHSNGNINSTDFGTSDTSVPFTGSVVASPVLTQNAGGFADRIFVVNTSGTLASMKLTDAATEWSGSTGLNSVSASPAFDCNRLASTAAKAATGILYIASGNGKLASIIVDSPKLDIAAKWPKYQRDAFNSGNTFLNFDNCAP